MKEFLAKQFEGWAFKGIVLTVFAWAICSSSAWAWQEMDKRYWKREEQISHEAKVKEAQSAIRESITEQTLGLTTRIEANAKAQREEISKLEATLSKQDDRVDRRLSTIEQDIKELLKRTQ